MTKYLVVKILDKESVSLPSTLVYGFVEFRSSNADSGCEVEILKESARKHHVDFKNYSVCARISTIVESTNPNEAIDIADNQFSEILDLKSNGFPMGNFKTSDIGLVKNLSTGNLEPIINDKYQPTMTFGMHQGYIQRVDFVNYILSLNTELSKRYRRSLHWSRNAMHESNSQIKILFFWFAIEALIKESEYDNIGGIIRWFLGFPNGKYRNTLSTSFLGKLINHPRYEYWDKKLITVIEEIRNFRNESTHSGFRSFDFTRNELELYSYVMIFGASRCQSAVQSALISRINTVSEFKEYIALLFEENVGVNDVHSNIIYTLSNLNKA